MAYTSETYIPPISELTVPELSITSGPLMAAAVHLGKYCDEKCKEFMICYQESFHNPIECLSEGKDVTKCGIEFFQKVKKSCSSEFTNYHICLDKRGGVYNDIFKCRKPQYIFDECMETKVGITRPEFGHFTRTRLHDTKRPRYEVGLAPMPEEIPDGPNFKDAPDPEKLSLYNKYTTRFFSYR